MIDNFHQHSYETKVRYLEGIAYLSRSQFDVLHGEQLHFFFILFKIPLPTMMLVRNEIIPAGFSPWRVMGSLTYVDLLAGATNNSDLLACSLSQRYRRDF